MPVFERDGVQLYYEIHGEGHPVLLFAPGGMRSRIEAWGTAPWDPIEALSGGFQVIAMDQRNAGRSRAPVREGDGWAAYTSDHVALLDHLGVARCHVLGGCIGGSYCLGLMEAAPERVTAAVLQQPIGLSPDNREAFFAMFDGWAEEQRALQPDVDDAVWSAFRQRMYGGDFVFNVGRDFVSRCTTPMLVLMGNDLYHPSDTSREIVRLAPNAELVEQWKGPEQVGPAVARVRAFLEEHTPG
jgi:pimeloyl-ACP methyl ester carboxylesterase